MGGNNGHSGSGSSGPDPSSSDFSADTVIYVGPCADDATDNEHPPVFLPSLNSGDNRCAMNRVLRGSAAEKPSAIKSPLKKSTAQKRKSIKCQFLIIFDISLSISLCSSKSISSKNRQSKT